MTISKKINSAKKGLRIIKDKDSEKKHPLRISCMAYGREKIGARVYYLVDDRGEGTEKKISEAVVLQRWRKRVFEGYTFSGSKLNPKIWRNLPIIFDGSPKTWGKLSIEMIKSILDEKRSLMRKHYISLPSANILKALFEICGSDRLKALVERHNHDSRKEKYGTPDLFLYAIQKSTGKASVARFVEVKRPDEEVSKDQHEEITFLQSLGLHAKVFRLQEPKKGKVKS
jgi:VRR-NUC domain